MSACPAAKRARTRSEASWRTRSAAAPRGNRDRDLGTRVEIEAVGLDAVAENDVVFRDRLNKGDEPAYFARAFHPPE